jgi:hypothetical protein
MNSIERRSRGLYLIMASAAAPDQDEENHGGKTNNHDIETCQIAVEHFGHLTCFRSRYSMTA